MRCFKHPRWLFGISEPSTVFYQLQLAKFKVGVKWFWQNTNVFGTFGRYVTLVRGYGTLVRSIFPNIRIDAIVKLQQETSIFCLVNPMAPILRFCEGGM